MLPAFAAGPPRPTKRSAASRGPAVPSALPNVSSSSVVTYSKASTSPHDAVARPTPWYESAHAPTTPAAHASS